MRVARGPGDSSTSPIPTSISSRWPAAWACPLGGPRAPRTSPPPSKKGWPRPDRPWWRSFSRVRFRRSASGVGEVDHHRGVVRGLLTLAGITVHEGPARPHSEIPAHQQKVDPHAPAVVEVAGPVIPPGERARRIEVAEDVDEPPLHHPAERGALSLADVGRPDELSRVPHVAIVGRHVEVPAHHHGAVRCTRVVDETAQAIEPFELEGVV